MGFHPRVRGVFHVQKGTCVSRFRDLLEIYYAPIPDVKIFELI